MLLIYKPIQMKSDKGLKGMFEKHSMSKVLRMFIVYCDPSEPYEPKSEWHCHMQSKANNNIEQDEDHYYSIEKFKSTYGQLIPAMEDKRQWPASSHGFFMHPPLLKATARRPKTERYKGCPEKKRKNGMHKCPICKDYDHHWHNCKRGDPEDIAAMMEVR